MRGRSSSRCGLLDYCLVNDGAVSLILTTVERARDPEEAACSRPAVGGKDTFRLHGLDSDLSTSNFWFDEVDTQRERSVHMVGVPDRATSTC